MFNGRQSVCSRLQTSQIQENIQQEDMFDYDLYWMDHLLYRVDINHENRKYSLHSVFTKKNDM
jgi:hypothetical protein